MRLFLLLAVIVMTSACSTTPPVTTQYYLARSALHVRVVRTLGCDEKNNPVIANTVTPAVSHVADASSPRQLELWRIDGPLANSDLKTEFTADGRLKSVNAQSTGQGETIIKTAIKLAELALEAGDRSAVEQACVELKAAFKDKPLTLVYELRDDLRHRNEPVIIKAEAQSVVNAAKYRPLLGDTCLTFAPELTPARPPVSYTRRDGEVSLAARQPEMVSLAVTTGPAGDCDAHVLWSGIVPVAQRGAEYHLPIPRAALFGKQVFAAAFDESGALTVLQYGKETGAPALLATVQAGGEAIDTSVAEEIAGLKGEADLIAAQQRLVRCQTNPATC